MEHLGQTHREQLLRRPTTRGSSRPPGLATSKSHRFLHYHKRTARWRVQRRKDGVLESRGSRATQQEALALAAEAGWANSTGSSRSRRGSRRAPMLGGIRGVVQRFRVLQDIYGNELPADLQDLIQRSCRNPSHFPSVYEL